MEDRQMNNEITTTSGLVNYNPGDATLLEMRGDSKRFPRLNEMPKGQVLVGLAKIVAQALMYRGQAVEANNVQFIASALAQELLSENNKYGTSYLTLAEIQVVVKRATLGGSEMFGVSVASIYKVIMDYVKGEGQILQRKVESLRRQAQRNQAYNNNQNK